MANTKRKNLIVVLSVLCAISIICLMVALAFCSDNNNEYLPANIPLETKDETEVISLSVGEAVSASDDSLSKTITAVVSPTINNNSLVDWSLSWQSADSDFAKGKNVGDYMLVTPLTDGSLTAIVSCTQPFGETIILRVQSRVKTNVYATCRLEYIKRFENFTVSVTNDNVSVSKINFSDDSSLYHFDFDGVFSLGTVSSGDVSYSVRFADSFVSAMTFQNNDGKFYLQTTDLKINDVFALNTAFPTYDNLNVGRDDFSTFATGVQFCIQLGLAPHVSNKEKSISLIETFNALAKKRLEAYSGHVIVITATWTDSLLGQTKTATKYIDKGSAQFESLNISSLAFADNTLNF